MVDEDDDARRMRTGAPVGVSTRRAPAELEPQSRPYPARPPRTDGPMLRKAAQALDAYEAHSRRNVPVAVVLATMLAGTFVGYLFGDLLGAPFGFLGGAVLSVFLIRALGLDR